MTTTTWTGADNDTWGNTPGAADTDWDTGLVPTLADDTVITGTPGTDIAAASPFAETRDLDFTGFAGTITGSFPQFRVYGDSIWGAGMTENSYNLTQYDDGSLTSNGKSFRTVSIQPGKTLTLVDALSIVSNALNPGSGTVAQGNNTITLGSGVGIALNGSYGWSYSAGAEIIKNGAGLLNGKTSDPTVTLPPLSLTGSGTLTVWWRHKYESLDLSGFTGQFHPDNDSGDNGPAKLITTEDMDLGSGCTYLMTGSPTFNCGGDLVFGASMNGGGGKTFFNVTGLALATGGGSQTITNLDFSGGTPLYADGCIDGGGNVNVLFEAPPEEEPEGPTEAEKQARGWWQGQGHGFGRNKDKNK